MFSTPVPDITNLKARITEAFATITECMLENTRREIDYRLNVLRATKGAHVEVYECVVKIFLSYILKNIYIFVFHYSSFLVINVCNQGKTLCSLCISTGDNTEVLGLLFPYVNFYMVFQSGVVIPWSNLQLVLSTNTVL